MTFDPAWPPPPPPGVTSPTRPTARWRRAVLTGALVIAVAAGGAAGYAGGQLADDGGDNPAAAPASTRSLAATDAAGIDAAGLATALEPSVVSVDTEVLQRNGPFEARGQGAGTGIILSADGEVLTNAHVVADAESITVTLAGESTPRQAELIGADTERDIALLKILDASGLTPAAMGNSDAVQVGDDVVAIGNALALEGGKTVTEGIVSAVGRSIQLPDGGSLDNLMQTDAAISSGSSGGPLVNAAGEVIGITSAGASGDSMTSVENIGFAIPINDALDIIAGLRA
jgi:S1-C subfamily serine protease